MGWLSPFPQIHRPQNTPHRDSGHDLATFVTPFTIFTILLYVNCTLNIPISILSSVGIHDMSHLGAITVSDLAALRLFHRIPSYIHHSTGHAYNVLEPNPKPNIPIHGTVIKVPNNRGMYSLKTWRGGPGHPHYRIRSDGTNTTSH